ncbi:hypothetical protein [Rhodococcoides kyotonense]|uniref:DUF2029 domain-containing protein n=1 Tax=Rhodococcoides kyotonense TaxID=398843 RepID=A0A177YJ70_9NOCA|nr:hypothetical protein [Rhodococcus kyotonensis]OAK55587.1 hypothetical protein A3K89_19780 [Rhodococcus kyotonensis]
MVTAQDSRTPVATERVVATVITVCAALAFVLRGVPRIRDAALFAEDGQIFLADAHNDGLGAVVAPYAGYLHVVPRIVAAVFEPLDVTAAPTAYVWAAIVVHLMMLLPALSVRLEWLLPSPILRAGLFASLALMPPLWEPYGNIANLIFVVGISLLLLTLSADPRSRWGRVAEFVAVGVIGLSGPLIVLFTPFFVWRWWRNGRTTASAGVVAVAVVAAVVQLSVYLTSSRSTPGGGTLVLLVKAAGEKVGGGWIAGDANVFVGTPHPWLTVAAYLWLGTVAVLSIVCIPRTAVVLWVLFGVLLYSAVNAYGPSLVGSATAFQRHVLVPTAICITLLWAVLGSRGHLFAKVVATICLVAGAVGVVHDFTPAPYPLRPDLSSVQECLDAGTQVCHQDIFDDGWSIDLDPA